MDKPKKSSVTNLLVAEMKRAIEIIESDERVTEPHRYGTSQSELRDINRMIRKHSIELEKHMYPKYPY